MKLSQVQTLLAEKGYSYEVRLVSGSMDFYRSKGFQPRQERGPFWLLSIPNPNHSKNVEIIFADASQDPEFYDLEFGGYGYELFDCRQEHLSGELLEEIRRILAEQTYVIIITDARTGQWRGDYLYYDLPKEELNDMAAFHRKMEKLRTPKNLWRKLLGKTRNYEVFSWETYQKITK